MFHGLSGENCIVRRDRSNTPLQALTLLNDPMFLEFAVAVAREAMEHEASAEGRAAFVFRRWLTRPPTDAQRDAILTYQRAQLSRLESGELSAATIVGDRNASNELASWVMVSRAVMNLDEVVTKP